jgi:phage terminase small subunit
MSLTPKQEAFVAEYLVDLNATAAAERAGYEHPNKQGPRMLVNIGIAKAIASAQAKRSERTEITQDYVLALIVDTAERCKMAADYNPNAVLKGAELLGRHLAMFTDNKTVTHHDGDRLDAVLERMGENAKPIGHPRSH